MWHFRSYAPPLPKPVTLRRRISKWLCPYLFSTPWSQYYLYVSGTMLEETITHLSSFCKTCSPINNAFTLVLCKLKNGILLRRSEPMYTETSAILRCKKFLQAAIFLVLISPTGSYTQIKWVGTFVNDSWIQCCQP